MPFVKKEKLDDLIRTGRGLANAAFNLSQGRPLTENAKESLKEGQEEWDKAYKDLRESIK